MTTFKIKMFVFLTYEWNASDMNFCIGTSVTRVNNPENHIYVYFRNYRVAVYV